MLSITERKLPLSCLSTWTHYSEIASFYLFIYLFFISGFGKWLSLVLTRSLSEVYPNKKSNLKSLVECFPKQVEESSEVKGAPLIYAMIPPVDGGHGLSHEQVMPFLKKLESGRQREGETCQQSVTE